MKQTLKRIYKVKRTWIVEAKSPTDAIKKALPGEHEEVDSKLLLIKVRNEEKSDNQKRTGKEGVRCKSIWESHCQTR